MYDDIYGTKIQTEQQRAKSPQGNQALGKQ